MKTPGGAMENKSENKNTSTEDNTSSSTVNCVTKSRVSNSSTVTPSATKPKSSMDSITAAIKFKQLLWKQTQAYQAHLREVVYDGDIIELKRFLEQKEGKVNLNWFDKEGQTVLHHGCVNGNVELVKVLVRHGADTSLANRDGWNPLHIATYGGHRDIALYLISAHAR